MVTVVAFYRAHPGRGDQIAAILTKQVAATRAEAGCLQFDACRSQDDPDEFLLYESYRNEAAFDAHRRSPHFLQYIEGEVVSLLQERTWHRYDQIVDP